MKDLLRSEMLSPFLHSCHEDKILLFSVHNLCLDVPLFLTQGLLLENIGDCIKYLPCGLNIMIVDMRLYLTEPKMICLAFALFLLNLIHPSLVVGSSANVDT